MTNPLSGVSVIESIVNQFAKLLSKLEKAVEKCEAKIESNKAEAIEIDRASQERIAKLTASTVEQENAILKAQTLSENIKSFIGEE